MNALWKNSVAIGVVVAAAQAVMSGQQAVFRIRADVVAANVSVRRGDNAVPGLKAADFEVMDNGVRQEVTDVTYESAPIDVTLLLDGSSSTSSLLARFASDTHEIAALLRPDDRIRLLEVDSDVRQLAPMQPASALTHLAITAGGLTSIYDALTAALISPVAGDHRQLVIAMTDGADNFSVLNSHAMLAVAQRSDAVLYVALAGSRVASGLPPRVPIREARQEGKPPTVSWGPPGMLRAPYADSNIPALQDAAHATGGELYKTAGSLEVFKKLFDEFKQSYVLHFTPTGVSETGWHDLTIKVPRFPKYVIRARRGYARDAA